MVTTPKVKYLEAHDRVRHSASLQLHVKPNVQRIMAYIKSNVQHPFNQTCKNPSTFGGTMQSTHDLLTEALVQRTPSQWAKALNVTPSAITNARQKRRLSPGMAANIAAELGKNPSAWALVAAQENEKEADLWQQLKSRVPTWNNSAAL